MCTITFGKLPYSGKSWRTNNIVEQYKCARCFEPFQSEKKSLISSLSFGDISWLTNAEVPELLFTPFFSSRKHKIKQSKINIKIFFMHSIS